MSIIQSVKRFFGASAQGGASAQQLALIANRPMLMSGASLDVMMASARSMANREAFSDSDDWAPYGSKPEHLVSVGGGFGVLSISGPLFQKWLDAYWWGGTAYETIRAAHQLLVNNPDVKTIVHVFDTGGGAVSGCFDTVDEIKSTRGQKPIIAVFSDTACSAGYALASAADKIVVSRTSAGASIGVISRHIDVSKWDDQVGLVYTDITSGEKKADFSPHAPLSESARADMQAEVDRLAVIFIDTVAANRALSSDAVRALNAAVLFGPALIAAGLADEIGTLESVIAAGVEPKETVVNIPDELVPVDGNKLDATQQVPALIQAPAPIDAETALKLDRAAAVDLVMAANIKPDLRIALLDPKAALTATTTQDRISHAQAVVDLCTACGDRSLAGDFITGNVSIETVRAQLTALKAADGPELVTSAPPKNISQTSTRESIYSRRAAASGAVTQRGKDKK